MLRLNPIFGDLGPAIIDTLAGLCSIKTLKAGALLFQKGDPGDALFGVRRGQISIEFTTDDGRRVILAALGSGDVFGEIALLDGQGRTADAVAAEATELFVLRRPDVLAYIAREPSVGIKLLEIVCQRLRSVSGQIEQSLTLRLEARLAARLVLLADDFGEEITITQENLARHVNATRESVNRQLQTWQGLGYLEVRRGRVVLKELAAMKAISKTNA